MINIKNLTISKTHTHLTDGDFSAMELAQTYLKNIGEQDKDVHAYLEVFDDVEHQAKEADAKIKKGDATLLTGIPVAMKDNILIKGKRVSAGSKILENYNATYDATVTQKLKEEGVVFLGRTNCDEFAMGSSTENSAYGVTKNPHDLSRVPGGSSGGSAASVSYDGALVSLGSDTGGSIRQPASFCGVVGLKPTYGTVSRHGLIAMASSLDQIGPFGNSVSDVEIVFDCIKGKDVMDGTSFDLKKKKMQKKPLTLGVPRHFFEEGVDSDVLKAFTVATEKLKDAGYNIKDIELPRVQHSLAVYYIIMPAEASTNLARFDGVKYGLHIDGDDLLGDYHNTRGKGFGAEVRRRIMLGTYVLSAGYFDAYYGKANKVRAQIAQDFNEAFQSVDAIITPTTPSPAFKIGEKSDPLSMYLSDIFTVPANLTGMPGLSVPTGTVDKEGSSLPVGFQILGPHMSEDTLFTIGKDLENVY